MSQSYIAICLIITLVIIQVASQTIWVDVDTGKVLGVSPEQGQPQQQQPLQQGPQQQYPRRFPQRHNGGFHRRHNWQQSNNGVQQPFVQQTPNPTSNDAEWVCRNSRTGDMMIIASEINNRTPEQMQQQPNYSERPTYTDNPYLNNPWLDRTNQQQPQPNNPDENNPRYPTMNNDERNSNNYPTVVQPLRTTETPTVAPVILTTATPTRSPFPTLDNIDWSKYVETTTEKSNAPSLNSAIDGEGILMPRGGDFQ